MIFESGAQKGEARAPKGDFKLAMHFFSITLPGIRRIPCRIPCRVVDVAHPVFQSYHPHTHTIQLKPEHTGSRDS